MKNIFVIILFIGFIKQTNGQESDLQNFDSISIQLDMGGGCFARFEQHIKIEFNKRRGNIIIKTNADIEKTSIKKKEIEIIYYDLVSLEPTKLKSHYGIKDSCNTFTGDFGGLITLRINDKDKRIVKKIEYESTTCSDSEVGKLSFWIMRKAHEICKDEN